MHNVTEQGQREGLQHKLGIPNLPVRMCDPDMIPAMCGEVRAACQAFPAVVSTVASDCGVSLGDFNSLNLRLKKDPLFRLRVQQEIRKIDRKERKSKIRYR